MQIRPMLVLAGYCVLGSFACHASPGGLSRPAVDTLPGGVARVRNSGPAEWRDTAGWSLVLERTIHPAAGSPGELAHPSSLVASDAGELYVLDRQPTVIKHFGSNGTFVGLISRQGRGPGEIEVGVPYLAHDTLAIEDAGQSRVTLFDGQGRFIRSWLSTPIAETGLVADDSARIPIAIPTGTSDINSGHAVARFRLDGTVADTVWYPPEAEPKVWRRHDAHTDMGMLIPFEPEAVATFDRAGRLISGDQSASVLRYSLHGRDTVRLVEFPAGDVAIADSIRQRTADDAVRQHTWLAGIASVNDLPKSYPRWSAIEVDGDNNLWIMAPGPHGADDHWLVIAPDGTLRGAVPAPFPADADMYWTRRRVYVIAEGADGTPEIRVYRIAK